MVQKETIPAPKRRGSAWKDAEKFQKIFSKKGPENYPIYAVNSGKNKLMKMLPDPPSIPLGTHGNESSLFAFIWCSLPFGA